MKAVEPTSCSCCPIRLGLITLFTFNITFGIVSLLMISENWGGLIIIMEHLHSSCMITSGVVGIIAMYTNKKRLIQISMVVYLIAEVIAIGNYIYILSVMEKVVDKSMNKYKGYAFEQENYEEKMQSIRKHTRIGLYLFFTGLLSFSIILMPIAINWMLIYTKWLKKERSFK
eukprot:NODE_26_length_35450_cov_0.398320.p16 type:complete len:172 gc:universal NODE_26_length_35450_cov_0.398320:16016-15501(-)